MTERFFDVKYLFDEEELTVYENLLREAQLYDDENEYMALFIDPEYAKNKVNEYIKWESTNAMLAEEYFESLESEYQHKMESESKCILENLTWTIVEPFYYKGDFDCNLVQHSCTNVYKKNKYLKDLFIDFVDIKNEVAKREYPNVCTEMERIIYCCTYKVNSVIYKVNENDNYIFLSKEECFLEFESELD